MDSDGCSKVHGAARRSSDAGSGGAADLRRETLLLPNSAREAMRAPLGPIVSEAELPEALRDAPLIIAVGDMVTLTLLRAGIRVGLAIFDYRTRREDLGELRGLLEKMGGDWFRVTSAPATISPELWETLERGLGLARDGKSVRVFVEGEEDLAAIPAIILAPDGSRVLYGMPGRGVVVVGVDGGSRARARELLGMFVASEEP